MKRLIGSFVAAVIFAGCSSVDHLEIDPKEVVLKRKNEGVWVKCIGKNKANHTVPKVGCSWRIGDDKIAVVDKDGKLQGRASGTTTVYAKSGQLEAEAIVRIEGVERIEVDPKNMTFTVGEPEREVKVKVYTYGDHLLSDRTPEFKPQNPDVAAVADGNKVFPQQPGEAKVTVYVDDVKYELPVTVLPKGKAPKATKDTKSKPDTKKAGKKHKA